MMLMKDLSPYNVDLNLYKQESYHCNLQLAPNYWIAILKSMPACSHRSDTALNVARYMEFHLKPKMNCRAPIYTIEGPKLHV